MSNNHRPRNSCYYVPRDLVRHNEFLHAGREDSSYLSIPRLLQLGLSDRYIWDHHLIHLLGELHPECSRYHQLDPEQWLLQIDLFFGLPY